MNLLPFPLLVLLTTCRIGTAQPTAADVPPPVQSSFRRNGAMVIGIFSILFSLTCLLLMYAKFCHSAAHGLLSHHPTVGRGILLLPPIHYNSSNSTADQVQRSFSGIDKSVVQSLPSFRFSSLNGSRDGLECAVCLLKFDDADVLRLLPKCKHAFHVGCVDRWLECHSTCPLCRRRIDPEDANAFRCSDSSRVLSGDRQELDGIGIVVEREPDHENMTKDGLLIVQSGKGRMHKFKHRIIVSDAVFRSRWSDMNASDFVALNSEMLDATSSKRFRGSGEGENSSHHARTRCMSEIADVPRFHGEKDSGSGDREKVRRVWLPIARRTVQSFAGKDRGSAEFQHDGGDSNV